MSITIFCLCTVFFSSSKKAGILRPQQASMNLRALFRHMNFLFWCQSKRVKENKINFKRTPQPIVNTEYATYKCRYLLFEIYGTVR